VNNAHNQAIVKIDRLIIKINEAILVCAISVMFLLVFANVIGRYFFSITYFWIDEISRYLMISLAFMGMGLAMRQGGHSSFTIFQNILPESARKSLRVAVLLIILGFMGFFCYLGLLYALRNMRNYTEALRWRNGYWYMMIPVGSLLFIWHTLIIAHEYINQSRQDEIEREIAAGDELTSESEYLKGIALEDADDEEAQ